MTCSFCCRTHGLVQLPHIRKHVEVLRTSNRHLGTLSSEYASYPELFKCQTETNFLVRYPAELYRHMSWFYAWPPGCAREVWHEFGGSGCNCIVGGKVTHCNEGPVISHINILQSIWENTTESTAHFVENGQMQKRGQYFISKLVITGLYPGTLT
jgi:hypothetical protein